MRPMRHWWLVIGVSTLLWLLTGCNLAWEVRAARTGTVEGRITSTTGGPVAWHGVGFEPINVPGVTVFNEPAYMTGQQGAYQMRLYAGVYDIRVRDPNAPDGWQRQRVTVLPMQVARVDFTLERSATVPHLGQVLHCDEEKRPPMLPVGTRLGPLSLDMSPQEVHAVLGEPEHVADRPNVLTEPLEWEFPDGIRVKFGRANGALVATIISTQSATLGSTAEGLAVGDPRDAFGQIYQDFRVCATDGGGLVVIGSNRRWLVVSFDDQDRVKGITVWGRSPLNEEWKRMLESMQ